MPFKKFLEKAGVRPEEALFVGDSVKKDVKGAKKLGMKTALAIYGADSKKGEVVADFELEEFGAIMVVLR